MDYLKNQLEKKDLELAKKEEQIREKDGIIADFGKQFGKLADQAQSLNLLDKPKSENNVSSGVSSTVSETENKETVESVEKSNEPTLKEKDRKRWWQRIFK